MFGLLGFFNIFCIPYCLLSTVLSVLWSKLNLDKNFVNCVMGGTSFLAFFEGVTF